MVLIKKYFWRGLISLIGLSFIITPIFYVSLGFIGQDTNGIITSYRRILGDRGEAIPNRYTYSLGYHFYLNSTEFSGSTTVIGSPLFIKPDGKNIVEIKYLEAAPYLNGLERDTHIDMGKFILIGVGLLLIYVMRPIREKNPSNHK